MVFHEHLHCVVTSCENPVKWRRVVHLTVEGAPGDEREGGDVRPGLIADVSIYLCDEHHDANMVADDAEPFPPEDE